ncbi:ATP-binding protein [Chloroflexota bacterium]
MRQKLLQSQEKLQNLVQQRTDELKALVRASQSLTSTLSLAELLNSVVSTAVDTLNTADSGVLFLYEKQHDVLVAESASGYSLKPLSTVRLSPGEGLAGKVFSTGRPLIYNDEHEVAGMLHTVREHNKLSLLEARGGINPFSMIGIPLESKGDIMGSLILTSFSQSGAFSNDDIPFLSSFAALAATMIEHQRLADEARQAESLREMDRAKTEFFSNISHELRTPLTSIMISSGSLIAADPDGKRDGTQTKLLQNIQRNAKRLNRLVGDLLDSSRLQVGSIKLNMELILLRDVIKESIETVRPMAETKRLSIKTHLLRKSILIKADHIRIIQVLINLLSNAVSFTPDGGSIKVVTTIDNGHATVQVSDTGIGISEKDQSHVFDRFYKGLADGTAHGMGLGLSIAKALVELHSGSISVTSIPEEGSTFSITIPIVEEDIDEGTNNR